MTGSLLNRRDVLKSSLMWAGEVWVGRSERASTFLSTNDRPRVGAVGAGSRWCQKATGLDGPHRTAPDFRKLGDYVAVCDVDEPCRNKAAELVKEWSGKAPDVLADNRAIIDRKDIDIVHLGQATRRPRT